MIFNYPNLTSVLCFLFQLVQSSHALRMLDIHLPNIAIFGKSVQLNCTYELEQDQLYSIKWFHNDQEFYRYLPNDNPPEQFYYTKGLYVDLSKSSKSLVYLRKVDLRTDGLFRVEVSAEAPSFQTVRKEKYLKVYYFPSEAPTLKFRNRTNDLRINDILDVKCHSSPARPATKLQFFINDIPMSQAYANLTETVNPIIIEDEVSEDENYRISKFGSSNNFDVNEEPTNQELNSIDNQLNSLNRDPINQSNSLVLFNTTLRLRVRLRQSLLKAKKTFNIRCVSYVTHLFTKSSEHVFQVLSSIKTKNEDSSDEQNQELSKPFYAFDRTKNSFLKNFNKKKFGPYIDNMQNNYATGDLINATCFAFSKPPAHLQWFIEDEEAPNEYLKYYKPIETKEGLKSQLGLEFKLTEQFLNNQLITTTQSIVDLTSTLDYGTFQDLNSNLNEISSTNANQTAIKLINKKREIKLKCVAQLSRIVHVRTRQYSLGDQNRLSAGSSIMNSNLSISHQLDNRFSISLILYIIIFFVFINHL